MARSLQAAHVAKRDRPVTPARPAVAPPAPNSLAAWGIGLLIAGVTAAIYAGAFDHAFVNWDDWDYVTQNALVLERRLGALLRTIVSLHYHPLSHVVAGSERLGAAVAAALHRHERHPARTRHAARVRARLGPLRPPRGRRRVRRPAVRHPSDARRVGGLDLGAQGRPARVVLPGGGTRLRSLIWIVPRSSKGRVAGADVRAVRARVPREGDRGVVPARHAAARLLEAAADPRAAGAARTSLPFSRRGAGVRPARDRGPGRPTSTAGLPSPAPTTRRSRRRARCRCSSGWHCRCTRASPTCGSLFVPRGLCTVHPYPSAAEARGVAYLLAPIGFAGLLALAWWDARRTRVATTSASAGTWRRWRRCCSGSPSAFRSCPSATPTCPISGSCSRSASGSTPWRSARARHSSP